MHFEVCEGMKAKICITNCSKGNSDLFRYFCSIYDTSGEKQEQVSYYIKQSIFQVYTVLQSIMEWFYF